MEVRELVRLFYEKLWNETDLGIADEILHPDVTFRGSVGVGATGRQQVCAYVRMVTTALSGYRCDVESLIAEGDRAAAKVRFSGLHVGEFLGSPPTGRRVEWIGAAFSSEMRTNCVTSGCWVTLTRFVPRSDQPPESVDSHV